MKVFFISLIITLFAFCENKKTKQQETDKKVLTCMVFMIEFNKNNRDVDRAVLGSFGCVLKYTDESK